MKSAMKRFLCLTLVVMMMVTAIPFAASAEGGIPVPVTVVDVDNSANAWDHTIEVPEGGYVTLDENLANGMIGGGYTYVGWYNGSRNVSGKPLSYEWLAQQSGYSLTLAVKAPAQNPDNGNQGGNDNGGSQVPPADDEQNNPPVQDPITVPVIVTDGVTQWNHSFVLAAGESVTLTPAFAQQWIGGSYSYDGWFKGNKSVEGNTLTYSWLAQQPAGYTLTLRVKAPQTTEPTTKPTDPPTEPSAPASQEVPVYVKVGEQKYSTGTVKTVTYNADGSVATVDGVSVNAFKASVTLNEAKALLIAADSSFAGKDFENLSVNVNKNSIVYVLTEKTPATTEPPVTEPVDSHTIRMHEYDGTVWEMNLVYDGRVYKTPNNMPNGKLISGKQFIEWNTNAYGYGKKVSAGSDATGITDLWAIYDFNRPTSDGMSKLTVYAWYYKDGIRQTKAIYAIDLPNSTNVYEWLINNRETIGNAVGTNFPYGEYQWYGSRLYYNVNGTTVVPADMQVAGNKSVYILLENRNPATVQLYVHKNPVSAPMIYDLPNLKDGDNVQRSSVASFLKSKGYNTTYMRGLYTADDWANICKYNSLAHTSERGSIYVNGYTQVHVVMNTTTPSSSSSSSSSSSGHSTNPKTGDTILSSIAALGFSASALAAAYYVSKKRTTR